MEENRANILRHMQICRFCLNADDNLANIYHSKNKKNVVPLPLQIMACAAIEVFENDGMPQLICEDCKNLALQAYSFKANCKKADDALKLFLATGTFNKPFSNRDFENYLPKGTAKIRQVRENPPLMKRIKLEPEHHLDSDSQASTSENQHQEHLEEFEIRPSANNEFSVKLVSSTPKTGGGHEDVKSIKTDCFSCTHCERSFPLKQLLDIHVKNHFRSRTCECHECNSSFFRKCDLETHKQVHCEEEGHFSCVVCKKEFTRLSNLKRHEKTHSDVAKFVCQACSFTFVTKEALVAHINNSHKKTRPFTCGECGKSFVFKQGLERHVAVHSEDKPHKCNYCEASFTSPIKLTRHVTSHAGLRPYPCKMCKRTFLLSHHLTRHMRSHYAAKSNNVQQIGQHKCDICSMSFRRKDSLINHSAIHSMVNLKCVICYTEFENAQAVKEHITTHLSGLPFPCEKCDYSFETKDQLEEHEVKHAEMEYEEQIEKEVVEEARAHGHLTDNQEEDDADYEEFGGDHMGKNGEDDEDYIDEEEEVRGLIGNSQFKESQVTAVRRSERTKKKKEYVDFLKDELESEVEEDEDINEVDEEDVQMHQTADAEEEPSHDGEVEVIKPIFRTEGTKVYKRKTPIQPKIVTSISADKAKTAPLSQINQPQVTTIENLGLTTKDLQDLPTEKFVNMKIGNRTVRVQKLVLTKEEMKAMAKEGKIRGNTVLIKNPGHLSNINSVSQTVNKVELQSLLNDSLSSEGSSRSFTKTYHKKKIDHEPSNATVVRRDLVIINDQIVDNIHDDPLSEMQEPDGSIDLQ